MAKDKWPKARCPRCPSHMRCIVPEDTPSPTPGCKRHIVEINDDRPPECMVLTTQPASEWECPECGLHVFMSDYEELEPDELDRG